MLLDRTLFVYGSVNSDGNRHNHDDLPVVVVGKGGGAVKGGRHLVFPRDRDTPICNLYLSMAERFGVDVSHFGDSTGKLPGLIISDGGRQSGVCTGTVWRPGLRGERHGQGALAQEPG